MTPGWPCGLSRAPREQYSVRGRDLARKVAARFPPWRWFATDRGDVEHVLGRYVDQVGDGKDVAAKNLSCELEATTCPRTGCSQRRRGEDREESSRWPVIPHSIILPDRLRKDFCLIHLGGRAGQFRHTRTLLRRQALKSAVIQIRPP